MTVTTETQRCFLWRRASPEKRILWISVLLWCALLSVMLVGCADRHDVRGLVLKVDPAVGLVTVSHDPIDGYMDAMVMPFAASRPQELKDVRPGDRIQFRLSVHRDGTMIDRIKILSAAPAGEGVPPGAMPSDATVRPAVAIGQPMPDVTLSDQDGAPVSLQSLRGQVVAVSFIYTRCPLPDYCPRVMTNLGALRDRFGDRLGKDVTLLTITFDPQYDTPEKMKEYARALWRGHPRLAAADRRPRGDRPRVFAVRRGVLARGRHDHAHAPDGSDRSRRATRRDGRGKEHSRRAQLARSRSDRHLSAVAATSRMRVGSRCARSR